MRYLHIFNRGVDKRIIYTDEGDYRRFEDTIRLSRLRNSPRLSKLKEQIQSGNVSQMDLVNLEKEYGPPLIKIQAYTLMPNHFHIEVKEVEVYAAQKFMQRLGNSYTKYFNTRHKRTGRLFESKFRHVVINTEQQQIHLARYIHTNPANSSKLKLTADQLILYPWSSLSDYLGIKKHPFCETSEIFSYFKDRDINDFWEFTKAGINKKELTLPPNLLIDDQ